MTQVYEKENLDERIAESVGWLCFCPTPWESMGNDAQQRRVSFKLSNQISLFGTDVTCIQQKTIKRNGHVVIVDEEWTLHDVPFGDNFQVFFSFFTHYIRLTLMTSYKPITEGQVQIPTSAYFCSSWTTLPTLHDSLVYHSA